MANPTSGDRPAFPTNGSIDGQRNGAASAPAAEDDQTLADGDQTRETTAGARLKAAAARDEAAHARDLAARARDQAAESRVLALVQVALASQDDDGATALRGSDHIIRAAGRRKRAAQHRAQAAELRELAAQDRDAAARDREASARERVQAMADRAALARELASSETDPLTGARTRAAGLTELDHEVSRCRRTDTQLVIACVDVVGLEALDDSEQHLAGDERLRRVVRTLRAHLRPYDLIVRLGGDELLCAMPGMTTADARQRVNAVVSEAYGCAVSAGFAELKPDETASALIARAGVDLLQDRRASQTSPPRPAT